MKNKKLNILMIMLYLSLSSCRERVVVVELQKINIDTTYTYKVERIDDDGKSYDFISRRFKLNNGDTIKEIY